jgi:hypothetical protein
MLGDMYGLGKSYAEYSASDRAIIDAIANEQEDTTIAQAIAGFEKGYRPAGYSTSRADDFVNNPFTQFIKGVIVDTAGNVAERKYGAKNSAPVVQPSFIEANKGLLIGGAAVVGVLVIIAVSKKKRSR